MAPCMSHLSTPHPVGVITAVYSDASLLEHPWYQMDCKERETGKERGCAKQSS